ncbi:ATP-binding cassette domain-containing protein [Lacticaseibacillus suihuaensis]
MKITPRKLRPWYLLTLVTVVLWSITSVLVPLFSGQFINGVMADHHQLFGRFFWLFLITSLAQIGLSTASTFLGLDLVKRVQNAFRQQIIGRLFRSVSYSEDRLAAATTDINVNSQAIAEQYVKGEIDICNCLVLIGASAIGLLTINLTLSAIILAVSLLIVFFPRLLAKRSQTNRVAQADAQDQLTKSLSSFMKGIETLNSFGAQRYFQAISLTNNQAIYRTEGRANRYVTGTNLVNAFLQVLKTFTIIGFGAYLITQGSLSIGGLLAAIQIAANLGAPMEVLSMLLYYRREATPIAKRLRLYTQDTAAAAVPVSDQPVTGITLKGFGETTADKTVLHDVDLTFVPGRKYLIVGKSGAGKSTLLRAIARINVGSPSGQLLINGSPDVAASRIKMVTQTPVVFYASLVDNLFMGQPVSAERQAAVLDLLELNDVVNRYGVTRSLNEAALSGGEKQRIALGRALLAEPDVLLLDEFNSALDAALSRKLEDYLLGLPCTVIAILHHQDAAARGRYDQMITVADGTVATVVDGGNRE